MPKSVKNKISPESENVEIESIEKSAKMGRPKIEIDWKSFENACELMATEDEICGLLRISPDTLLRRVKEKYNMTFAEYIKNAGGVAKVSLRRNLFKLSKRNAAVAIFLGKNYLGMVDSFRHEINRIDLEDVQNFFEDNRDENGDEE